MKLSKKNDIIILIIAIVCVLLVLFMFPYFDNRSSYTKSNILAENDSYNAKTWNGQYLDNDSYQFTTTGFTGTRTVLYFYVESDYAEIEIETELKNTTGNVEVVLVNYQEITILAKENEPSTSTLSLPKGKYPLKLVSKNTDTDFIVEYNVLSGKVEIGSSY